MNPNTGLREVRVQPFGWNPDDSPNFGSPVATGASVEEPSGTPTFYSAMMTNPMHTKSKVFTATLRSRLSVVDELELLK